MLTIFLKIILLKKKFNFWGYFWISFPLKNKNCKFLKILNFYKKNQKFFLNFFVSKKNFLNSFFHGLGERRKNIGILVFDCLKVTENLFFYLKEFNIYNIGFINFFKKNKNIYSSLSYSFFFKKKRNFFFFTIPPLHEKDSLWNDIFHFLFIEKKNLRNSILYFNFFCFLNIVEESLWILDSQYNKFLQRRIHGGKISMPPSFLMEFFGPKFYDNIWIISKNNNPKRKLKILKESELRKLSLNIQFSYNSKNFIFHNSMNKSDWLGAICKLPETFVSYAEYNKVCLDRTTKNHLRKVFRDQKRFMEINTIHSYEIDEFPEKNSEIKIKIFFELKNLKNYFPFNIFSLLPSGKQERAKILEDLDFPFPIEILKYFPGSNKRKTVVCWKIPKNPNQRSIIKKNTLILKEMKSFPIFYSRAMLKSINKEKNCT
ncbi:hypothetical protein HAN_3g463 (nucleomorph) [Hemiselmis andersenii]|uniref:Uncharacterized protein n=3 Tax=Hemiselmis andersenii TaxID=464988 RepID=A9BL82_HEMAN|nr:hypothetical protein HAN_3g463 [Hemiselmis andersenii]ABW98265.1 hypothetical protein HAN_3g463 [Hemiselmis andersenii]